MMMGNLGDNKEAIPFGETWDNLMEFIALQNLKWLDMSMNTLPNRDWYKYSLREGIQIIYSYLSCA